MLKPPSKNAHKFVKLLDRLIAEHRTTRAAVAERSGIHKKTLEQWWRDGANPSVRNVEAALAVFDYEIVAREVRT